MMRNILIFLFAAVALFLVIHFAGWLPILTFLGFRAVESEDAISDYENEVAPILEEWKAVINDWEEAASNPERSAYWYLDAEDAYDRMQNILVSWDAITPPEELKQYHFWMRHAMNYEKEAFGIMVEYYCLGEYSDPEEFDRLRNLGVELWALKDKALFEAGASYPE